MTTSGSALHMAVEQLQLYAKNIEKPLSWECKMKGPAHDILFTFCAKVGEETFPEAQGKTKKEAKYNAAKIALETLNLQNMALDRTTQTTSPAGMGNYISKLNEYGQKKSTHPDYRFSQINTGMDHVQKFSCRVVMDKKEYPIGYGRSKQDAKREAARLAYEEIDPILPLCKDMAKFDVENGEEPKSIAEGSPDQNPKRLTADEIDENEKRNEEYTSTASMDGTSQDFNSRPLEQNWKNAIGELHEYCQKRNLPCKVVEVDKRGPSHTPEFTLQFEINGKPFPSASGENKQKAKQKAAILALKELKASDVSWWTQELSSVSEDDLVLKGSPEDSDGSSFISFRDSKTAPHTPKAVTTDGSKSKRRLAPSFTAPDSETDSTSFQIDSSSGQDPSLEVKIEGFSEIEEIGKGGFGCVYKAKNDIDKKYYAIKEVPVQDNEKTVREAESLAKMEHINIVRYHHSWFAKSTQINRRITKSLFIKMELYNRNLREWIMDSENSKPAQKEVALSIFRQLLDGVVYIHQLNMIHRDLKPANIFLKEEATVKIGDFGLVRTLDDQKSLTTNIGTPRYMSPEQKWNDIRLGKLPSSFFDNCPFQSCLIRKMLCEIARERPEAEEVKRKLESDYNQESKTI
ncbi:interferon-induced, double-stranded RNA-activated protein kinase isoform X2 [Carcharodon carcharias]|uniref:interferon-induced, double-stranded RNA-activated protein kinase isoform X2 n=1 Tax=Carcharodon carcharias TaxID=13397 RepID=UPI001B7DBF61|nr:interferon-induced, double-stranded RNA-activated protein kinase isoform X2 [Carcharodon carcharias]